MALPNDTTPTFFNIRGRSGFDSPLQLMEGHCIEALNIDWFGSTLGRKRGGTDAVNVTGGTAFTGSIRRMGRFVPSDDQTAAELFAMDASGLVKRLAASSSWADVTLVDAITSVAGTSFTELNGKYYFAYKSAVNRLHVYDPVSAKVRRVGLALPAAPSVANTGAGAYAAVIRYYKVSYTKQIAGVVVLRSDLSAATSFTPSGAGTAARITKPAALGEDETHWEVWASYDDGEYFFQTSLAVGTTTYDDGIAPSTYTGDTPEVSGTYTPPPSCKYMVSDDARVIMAGAHETSFTTGQTVPSVRRVWWTSPPDSTGVGDDERVEQSDDIKSYSDVDEAITGLSVPVNGSFRVFSYRSQWAFVPTGSPQNPYNRYRIAGASGCISHDSIVAARDSSGSPCLYWWSPNGPMRAGQFGEQFIGQDIMDIIQRVNKASISPIHAVYHEDKHQVWFWVPVDSGIPNTLCIFDTNLGQMVQSITGATQVRFGWSIFNGIPASAYCSCMFSETVGASMSYELKPYAAYTDTELLVQCDTDSDSDLGDGFMAYVESKPMAAWPIGMVGGFNSGPILIANVAANVSIQMIILPNESANAIYSEVDLSPMSQSESETMVFPQFDVDMTGADMFRIRLGDAVANTDAWNIHALSLPTTGEGKR